MRTDRVVVISLIIVAVILMGEAYAYVGHEAGYDSSVHEEGDIIKVEMSVKGSIEFDAVSIDNGDRPPTSSLYIFYDPESPVMANEDTAVPLGSVPLTAGYYVDQLRRHLGYRHFTDIEVLGTDGLYATVVSDVSDGKCKGKGLVCITGCLPSSLLSDDVDCPIMKWICSGGTLYWIGEELLRYSDDNGSVTDVSAGRHIRYGLTYSEKDFATSDSDIREQFSFSSNDLMFSPMVTDGLHAGYSNGVCSVITYLGYGEGDVCVVSGEYSFPQIEDLAICIASGLTSDSAITDWQSGVVSGRSVIGMDSGSGDNQSVYVQYGGYFCVFGKRHTIDTS